MKLSYVAKALGQELLTGDFSLNAVSIDTRSLQQGDLFFALKGPNFDGHDFLLQAKEAGAGAAIVERSVDIDLPLIVVPDTHRALMNLARYHRSQISLPVIAVTGSCGKTTTRALMESIFAQCGSVLASQKSYNNNIGVPLTLLGLTREHDYAVLELGANHAGEIAELVEMVKPDTTMITNAAAAHLEGFGSLEGVAHAKGEIFSGLGPDGTAIINQDDAFAPLWHELAAPRRVITFGVESEADIMAKDIVLNARAQARFRLVTPQGEVEVELPFLGEHNVRNALAATGAALSHDVPIDAIKMGLEQAVAVTRRLIESKGLKGATVIDDSYNANPHSVTAAIDFLVKRQGRPILVFGDMLELGELARASHEQIGSHALRSGVARLYCYGEQSRFAAEAFGEHGYYFQDQSELLMKLQNDMQKDDTVLVKGSFSMGMNKVVEGLLGDK